MRYTYLQHGFLFLAALILLLPTVVLAQAETETPTVSVVSVDEEIRAGTVQFVSRSLRAAEEANTSLFLLELNTPGGLLTATEDISRLLVNSEVPTAVYVYQDSGWAFSAGLFILLSADTAASHPTASIGAAAPVLSSGGEVDEKTRNATIAWIESLAQRSDRDTDTIRAFVTENQTVSGQEALDLGVVDIVASDRHALLDELGLATAEVQEHSPTVVDGMFSFFSIPYLIPLLLTLGSLGLVLAFRTGELAVMGAVSLILLLLGLWGSGMVQLSSVGVIVLVLGITLIAFELFIDGADFGASGVIGLVAVLLGVATFANEPFFPDVFSYGLLPALLAGFVAGIVIIGGIAYFAASAIRQPHATGTEALIGRTAVVHHTLAPTGVVLLDGERYTARAQSGAEYSAGATVTVTAMEGNVAIVDGDE